MRRQPLLVRVVLIVATALAVLSIIRSTSKDLNDNSVSTTNDEPMRFTKMSSRTLDTLEVFDLQWVTAEWAALKNDTTKPYLKLPNAVIPGKKGVDSDITVAVHTAIVRLNRLLVSVQRWGGPVSVAIRITKKEEITKLHKFVHQYAEQLQNTSIHLFLETNNKLEYPHNILRNMALQQVTTDYFLSLDVDFVTRNHCHDKLQKLLRSDPKVVGALKNKTLLVLPSFNHEAFVSDEELLNYTGLPTTKKEVISMVKLKNLTEFHVASFPDGHGPTKFDRWYAQKKTTESSFYYIDYALRFEPYVIGYRPGTHHYWEGFRGFGYNKYSWYVEAHYSGYHYAVLYDFFVLHLDHPSTPKKRSVPIEMDVEWLTYQRYLETNYGAKPKDFEPLWKDSAKYRVRDALAVQAYIKQLCRNRQYPCDCGSSR